MNRNRCCCNCRHNIRIPDDGFCKCLCEIDYHYINYIETFEGWCRRWAKDHSFDGEEDGE